jgi:hypothetical protein
MPRYVGLDIHKQTIEACFIDEEGTGTATQWVSARTSIPAALRCTFFKRALSRVRWLLAFFDGLLVIEFLCFEFG